MKAAKHVACSEYVQGTRLRMQELVIGVDGGEMKVTTTCVVCVWCFGDRGMCFRQYWVQVLAWRCGPETHTDEANV